LTTGTVSQTPNAANVTSTDAGSLGDECRNPVREMGGVRMAETPQRRQEAKVLNYQEDKESGRIAEEPGGRVARPDDRKGVARVSGISLCLHSSELLLLRLAR
jgi:hypothetical protein